MPLSVEEGIANGVPEVRKAVRYQIKYGAGVIKISASGGVMSHSTGAGRAAVLRRGARGDRRRGAPGRPQGRRARPRRRRHPGVHPRRRRLHRARLARERRHHPDDGRARHVPRADELPRRRASTSSRAAPELQAKAAEVFPQARAMLGKAIAAGREDRVRHRRARDPARRERQGAVGDGRPGHDADAGAAGGDGDERGAHRRRTTAAASRPGCSPTSSRCPATRPRTSR